VPGADPEALIADLLGHRDATLEADPQRESRAEAYMLGCLAGLLPAAGEREEFLTGATARGPVAADRLPGGRAIGAHNNAASPPRLVAASHPTIGKCIRPASVLAVHHPRQLGRFSS
jgi:hypothetical protein